MSNRPAKNARAPAPLTAAGTFDARGVWREHDAPPSPEVRAFVDAVDRIPFTGPRRSASRTALHGTAPE
ncbi:hypothetical protein tb265_20080 [Gemmatimonadetes bacterium T265]|nr:hypothetical protein tb265_20080 [Gemmatimonadetes bacterium T265]